MTRPAGFEPLEEGWAALTEALAAAGVHVDEVTARHAARAAVIDTMQRGWVISHTDHTRTIRAEVEAAVRPLREYVDQQQALWEAVRAERDKFARDMEQRARDRDLSRRSGVVAGPDLDGAVASRRVGEPLGGPVAGVHGVGGVDLEDERHAGREDQSAGAVVGPNLDGEHRDAPVERSVGEDVLGGELQSDEVRVADGVRLGAVTQSSHGLSPSVQAAVLDTPRATRTVGDSLGVAAVPTAAAAPRHTVLSDEVTRR